MDCYVTDYNIPGANIALEDSIMQKGEPVTAGSKMLENFISPFDATVVARLAANKISVSKKTQMDEFCIPALLDNAPSMPQREEISGAIKAVLEGIPFALCNDLFGTYRRQTAENGLCYIHPTYGAVSRFGLVPSVSSMDQIGVACKNLADGFNMLSLIAGKDEKDGAMFPEKKYHYTKTDKKIRVCVPASIVNHADESIRAGIDEFAGKFDRCNAELPYFDLYKQIMYILAGAEISNNISRYDGIKFGHRTSGYKGINDIYVNSRTEGFGIHTKLMAIMGSFVLSQEQYIPYYEKAMKLRRMIKNALTFDQYDMIVLPASIGGGPYENLSLYALAQLAGLPSVSFSYNGCAIQLIANIKDENTLLTAWEEVRT